MKKLKPTNTTEKLLDSTVILDTFKALCVEAQRDLGKLIALNEDGTLPVLEYTREFEQEFVCMVNDFYRFLLRLAHGFAKHRSPNSDKLQIQACDVLKAWQLLQTCSD